MCPSFNPTGSFFWINSRPDKHSIPTYFLGLIFQTDYILILRCRTNNCGTTDSPSAKCQTLIINSADDFCLWAPATKMTVGDAERDVVSWCTKPGHGSRLIPKGALTGVHFVQTRNYIQITGTGDFTKMNIPKGDEGGELDPHGADGNGNPIGALVIGTSNGKKQQFQEWTEFISYNEFCIRACFGDGAAENCQHIYLSYFLFHSLDDPGPNLSLAALLQDVMGCYWNMPANYAKGSFDTCKANPPKLPMGQYYVDGGKSISTWYQGIKPTPAAQAVPKSSSCKKISSPGGAAYR
ncbi:hypothetical protein T439DRAFT_287485 [Meredithblackwellia eburnea MCA 4105]